MYPPSSLFRHHHRLITPNYSRLRVYFSRSAAAGRVGSSSACECSRVSKELREKKILFPSEARKGRRVVRLYVVEHGRKGPSAAAARKEPPRAKRGSFPTPRSTHVDSDSLLPEDLQLWPVLWNVSVELVLVLVPLDRVQRPALHVELAPQVRVLTDEAVRRDVDFLQFQCHSA